jgi:hypothetical protein
LHFLTRFQGDSSVRCRHRGREAAQDIGDNGSRVAHPRRIEQPMPWEITMSWFVIGIMFTIGIALALLAIYGVVYAFFAAARIDPPFGWGRTYIAVLLVVLVFGMLVVAAPGGGLPLRTPASSLSRH